MCLTKTGVTASLLCLTLLTVSAQQLSSGDKEFLEKAAKGGMQEVQMGKMGMQRGSSPAVKKYSQRLVNDHKKANQELMALAKRKGVTLPSNSTDGGAMPGSPHGSAHGDADSVAKGGTKTSTGTGRQASSPESDSRNASHRGAASQATSTPSEQGPDILAGKNGSDFDQEFARLAIADHEKDIAEFEKAASSASDSDIRAWATKTLPTLRAHLKEAQNLSK